MVVNPENLERKIHEENLSASQRFEQQLDRELDRRYNGHSATIYLSGMPTLRPMVFDALLDKYRAAGWDIEKKYDSDPRERDGPRLVMKKKKIPRHQNENFETGQYYGPSGIGRFRPYDC